MYHHDYYFSPPRENPVIRFFRRILTTLLHLLPYDPTMPTPADLQSAVDSLKGVILAFPTQALNDAADKVVTFIANQPAGTDLTPFIAAVTELQTAAQAENDAAAAVISKLTAAVPAV